MSFEIRSAIDCLEHQIKDGEFNALAIINYLTHEYDIWTNHLSRMGVSASLIKHYKTAYEFKRDLGEDIKTKFEWDGDCFLPQFLKAITMSDLKEFTSKHNLCSALLEYTKEKVRQLLGDIDDDVLESVLNKVRKQMENENE